MENLNVTEIWVNGELAGGSKLNVPVASGKTVTVDAYSHANLVYTTTLVIPDSAQTSTPKPTPAPTQAPTAAPTPAPTPLATPEPTSQKSDYIGKWVMFAGVDGSKYLSPSELGASITVEFFKDDTAFLVVNGEEDWYTWHIENGNAVMEYEESDEREVMHYEDGILVWPQYYNDEKLFDLLLSRTSNDATPTPEPTKEPASEGRSDVYALDLSEVEKTNDTRGKGFVTLVSGSPSAEALYARVTWVYTLSSGDSFAYCAMKDVVASGDKMSFNMVSPRAPYGATLDAVQVALVTDPAADSKGSYDSLATARK